MASLDSANNLPVAWPNTIYQAFEADPAMDPTSWEFQWQHDVADTTYAWEEGYDGEGVTVAVLDTGIRLGHEDLNPAKVGCTSYDKEEMIEEWESEYRGEDFDYEISPDDLYVGHGTHVSGIIAAVADNGKGGAGIAPGVDLLSCNVFMADWGASTDDIIEGIVWAQENDADIINMSLGGIVYNGVFAKAVKNAYDNGVAVFCAAGNDSTATYQYPASYPGAISIAALDRGLQKSSFSCYGDKIRYAFPGVDIYSTANATYDWETDITTITTDAYTKMSGTSMACPVGAGVAAVALNYAEANGMMQGLTGAAKVEKLLSVMDSALIPISTKGLGKGTVSLSKLVGATTFEATPDVPIITENKAGKYEAASVDVAFKEQKNVIICYTTDGKKPQYKNGAPVGTTRIAEPTAYVGGKKSVTLKAIAVNPKTGLCSKVMTAKYTLAPLPVAVVPDGYTYSAVISQGGSYTIKAKVYPDYAANKKVVWSIASAPEGATGVTVSSKGVVKAAKNATPGFYRVKVEAAAKETVYSYFTVKVEAPKKNVVSITSDKTSYNIALGEAVSIQGIKIETNDGSVLGVEDLAWTSSNKKVAVLVQLEELSIGGLKTGKAKITGTAKDGSNKKITLNVTVVDPVKAVSIDGSDIVAVGKSITLNTYAYTSGYANKNASAFDWSVEPANGGVTVKNGKVTASKKALEGWYTIKAVAKDGYGAEDVWHIEVTSNAVKSIKVAKKDTNITVARDLDNTNENWFTIPVEVNGGALYSFETIVQDEKLLQDAYLGYHDTENGRQYGISMEVGEFVGTTTVTLKSIDGTNKSIKVKVTVTNPISNLAITFPDGSSPALAYTKSMKLVPVFSTDNGVVKNADKTLTWKSSDPSIISVDKNGKVTAKASEGYAYITAYSEIYGISGGMTVCASDLITKAELVILDSDEGVNEEGQKIESGIVTLKVKTKQNGTKYLSRWHADAFNTAANKEGITFTHGVYHFHDEEVYFTAAEYVINKPGTYTATFSLRDGNKVKVKHKFTMK